MTLARPPRTRPRPADDAEALARTARGDVSALGDVYDRHAPAVRRFVAKLTSNGNDVDDIVQMTFVTAARRAAVFDPSLPCRAWLLGIAVRHASAHRRAARRFAALMNAFLPFAEESRSVDPRARLLAKSELSRAQRALSKLSAEKRSVFLLTEVEGLSGEEIARALEIPIGTVWTRLHHARRELRVLLREGGDT